MKSVTRRFGLSCALATPFDEAGHCDIPRLVAHACSRIASGCSSVTVFGTTGEGASLAGEERAVILAAFARSGFDLPQQLVVGICASAAEDAIAQIAAAQAFGVRMFLLPPPFYFKNVRDPGLHAWFRRVLEGLSPQPAEVLLYHIPSVTGVPLPVELVEQLARDFPSRIRGVKDSSGDWGYSQRLLAHADRLTILIGDERHLAKAVTLGAEGAISGTANFFPELLLPLVRDGRDDPRVNQTVETILRFPVTPAVKTLLAHLTGDAQWRRVAPPLMPLADDEAGQLICSYGAIVGGGPQAVVAC